MYRAIDRQCIGNLSWSPCSTQHGISVSIKRLLGWYRLYGSRDACCKHERLVLLRSRNHRPYNLFGRRIHDGDLRRARHDVAERQEGHERITHRIRPDHRVVRDLPNSGMVVLSLKWCSLLEEIRTDLAE